ncbi:MAG: response regulator [Mariprofundaceae bacterium]
MKYYEFATSHDYQSPDVVITDVMMPQMNGYQLMRKISEIHPRIKFIVMTGYEEVKDKFQSLPHIFIRKPFHPERFNLAIQDLINDTKNYCEASKPTIKLNSMD